MQPDLKKRGLLSPMKDIFLRWQKTPPVDPRIFIIVSIAILTTVLSGILFFSFQTSNTADNEPLTSNDSLLPDQNNLTPVPATDKPAPTPTTSPVRPRATTTPKPTAKPTPIPPQAPTSTPASAVSFGPAATPNPNSAKVVNLSMDPSSTMTTANQSFSLTLRLDTGSDQVTGAELHIDFDHTKLQIQSFTAGSFLPVVLIPETHDNGAGNASVTLGSSTGVSGSGTLATITFMALTTGSAPVNYNSSTQTSSIGRGSNNSLNSSSGSTITIN